MQTGKDAEKYFLLCTSVCLQNVEKDTEEQELMELWKDNTLFARLQCDSLTFLLSPGSITHHHRYSALGNPVNTTGFF